MSGQKVYGGGQPIPFSAASASVAASGNSGKSHSATSAQATSNVTNRNANATSHQNFGSISYASSGGNQADYSSAGGGSGVIHSSAGYGAYGSASPQPPNGTVGGKTYTGFGSSTNESSGVFGIAKAVGGALFYPITAVAAAASASPPQPLLNSSTVSNYDPRLSAFPLLPRFRGGAVDSTLYPVPFNSTSSPSRTPHAAAIHAVGVQNQQNLSSLLNSPVFSQDEVEPPAFYLIPLPAPYNESVASIQAMLKAYTTASGISGEYLVYQSHHGTWLHPIQTSDHDSSDIAAEKRAMAALVECQQVVPEKYFSPDFSVAQEALMVYEAQLAAAAAEAEAEENAPPSSSTSSASGLPPKHGSNSASSFYSSFSSPLNSNGGAGNASSAHQKQDSTYFQAAWAATHAPTQSKYSPDAIGIVPGVVGALVVTPAKAAASLYKLFNKVTGGTSPTGMKLSSTASLVATSHQRSIPFSPAAVRSKHRGSGSHSSFPTSTEELNALQLQQILASHLDLVEITLMQLVGSKSKAFFASLATIQLLGREVDEALEGVASIRRNMAVLQKKLVVGSMGVLSQQRQLHNAKKLEAILDIVASLAKTPATIKLLLSNFEFGAAIHLIQSTLAIIRSPDFKSLKCLNQMEIKLKENLKLIDMLMMTEFVSLALPDSLFPNAGGGESFDAPPPKFAITTAEGKAALKAQVAISEDERERLLGLIQSLYSFGTILPALLKYSTELRQYVAEEANDFWRAYLLDHAQKHPKKEHPTHMSSLSNGNLATPSSSSVPTPSHAEFTAAKPSPAGTNLATPSAAATPASASTPSSFMSSLIPNALKRTNSITTLPAPAADDTKSGDTLAPTPQAATTLQSPSTSPPAVSSIPIEPAAVEAAVQPLLSSLPHAEFLRLQAKFHTKLLAVVYRATAVRDLLMEATSVAMHQSSSSTPMNGAHVSTPSAAEVQPHSITPTRLKLEFRDLLKSLLAMTTRDSESGAVERCAWKLLEYRQKAHAKLDLYEMKEFFEQTMDLVREMEEIGQQAVNMAEEPQSNGSSTAASGTAAAKKVDAKEKFVCLELRKVTLAHEKGFLAAIQSKLVNELTSSMERDNWDRIDVPRSYQVLLDSFFTSRPIALRKLGAAASRGAINQTDAVEEENASPASYLFVENTDADGSVSSLAKYPISASVLTLLSHVSFYCESSIQLKGVAADILKSLMQLFTLFNSRAMQLILGAGAVQVNPDVKVITSKHLALTSQCLSLLLSQFAVVKKLLTTYFPDKHHPQLTKDFARITHDYNEHIKELFTKLESMALEVCESCCKGIVQWIKREEEIAVLQARQAQSSLASNPASTTSASASSDKPGQNLSVVNSMGNTTNDLPSLFKLFTRLLTQSEALHNVLSDFLQPSQRIGIMQRIYHGYIERFHKFFNPGAAASNQTVNVASLINTHSRMKLSKRMEATLEKFRGWIPNEDYESMKKELSIFILATASASPSPSPAPVVAPTSVAVAASSNASNAEVVTLAPVTPSSEPVSPQPSSDLP